MYFFFLNGCRVLCPQNPTQNRRRNKSDEWSVFGVCVLCGFAVAIPHINASVDPCLAAVLAGSGGQAQVLWYMYNRLYCNDNPMCLCEMCVWYNTLVLYTLHTYGVGFGRESSVRAREVWCCRRCSRWSALQYYHTYRTYLRKTCTHGELPYALLHDTWGFFTS